MTTDVSIPERAMRCRVSPQFQAILDRDARRLTELQRRIIHRQFETDINHCRFAPLLTKD